VVTRQEIIDVVWATEYIADNTLTHCITEIRNALGDDARNPEYIETIHKRGYRLIAQVRSAEQSIQETLIPSSAGRVDGDDRSPYPGLAAFTEADAEFFFGREEEVARMWRKLTSRKLLAVIGPSGVGKSSFLGAGVIPAKPEGWNVILCEPGEAPFASLARALVPGFAGDAEAIARLVDINECDGAVAMVSRWRDRNRQALLIVDQFEELFTLNPAEAQFAFSTFLRRLVDDADVHVLLAMRDDFLFRVHDHPPLAPVLDELTLLGAPAPDSLRRALVEPAGRLGFTFENDALPSEMITEVEGERGALPMVAFAVARLWDGRDHDWKLLTNRAYDDIGGVGGALAQHAEAILKSLGEGNLPIVREVFRNLVTAGGTRSVRDFNELITVFPESRRDDAEGVLRHLINSRLLTSFEDEDVEGGGHRRVEIVHESLLASWPRLLRWQTQDADAAQLRDQLRQAARTWDEHEKADDFLWTDKAYREFVVWKEDYPGGLTAIEDDFVRAMDAHARRRKRRRRVLAVSALVLAVAVATVFGALWRRSVQETRRAEAANLLSRAQLQLESYPSAALAFATSSLELSDSFEARQLALEALWKGPTAFVVNEEPTWNIEFSPDGQTLVQTTDAPPYRVHLIGADGTDVSFDDVHGDRVGLTMDTESGLFATWPWANDEPWALWSATQRKVLTQADYGGWPDNIYHMVLDLDRSRALLMPVEDNEWYVDAFGFDGVSKRLGIFPFQLRETVAGCGTYSPIGDWTAMSDGKNVYVVDFDDHSISEPRRLGPIEGQIAYIECDPLGRFLATRTVDGKIHLSDLHGHEPTKVIQGPSETIEGAYYKVLVAPGASHVDVERRQRHKREAWVYSFVGDEPRLIRYVDLGKPGDVGSWAFNPVGYQIVSIVNPDPKIRLWSTEAPADAEPVIMQRGDVGVLMRVKIHPNGSWIANSSRTGLSLWPIAQPYPVVINRYQERVGWLAFDPEGRWLASSGLDSSGFVRAWELEGDALPAARTVHETGTYALGISASPDGKHMLLGNWSRSVKLVSLDGDPSVDLPGIVKRSGGTAFSADGRLAAASGHTEDSVSRVVRVWDVALGEQVVVFDLGGIERIGLVHFTPEDDLVVGSSVGLLKLKLGESSSETLIEGPVGRTAVSADGSRAILVRDIGGPKAALFQTGPVVLYELKTGITTPLTSHGERVTTVATDAGGTMVVTGDIDGVIRIGPIDGEQPHLFLGSPDEILDIAVDPKGRWVASSSGTEVRLWPMPDLSKPPLHTLPRGELIAKLKTLTNLRVVRDEESSTGWKLTHDPFPGWETVPEW
jgi:WD40 repeat protein